MTDVVLQTDPVDRALLRLDKIDVLLVTEQAKTPRTSEMGGCSVSLRGNALRCAYLPVVCWRSVAPTCVSPKKSRTWSRAMTTITKPRSTSTEASRGQVSVPGVASMTIARWRSPTAIRASGSRAWKLCRDDASRNVRDLPASRPVPGGTASRAVSRAQEPPGGGNLRMCVMLTGYPGAAARGPDAWHEPMNPTSSTAPPRGS